MCDLYSHKQHNLKNTKKTLLFYFIVWKQPQTYVAIKATSWSVWWSLIWSEILSLIYHSKCGRQSGFMYIISVGNGNPLPYSCLENSMDRGIWQVQFTELQSWTRLKWLSMQMLIFHPLVGRRCHSICNHVDFKTSKLLFNPLVAKNPVTINHQVIILLISQEF